MSRDGDRVPEADPPYAQITVPLLGLSDASCAIDIEQGLARIPGIMRVRVNYPAERALISYDPRSVTPQGIAEAIGELGYIAVVPPVAIDAARADPEQLRQTRTRQERSVLNKLVFATVLTVPACLIAWVPTLAFTGDELVLFILTTPVVFIAGSGFFAKAWGAFRRNYANLDLLIAIGALAAWSYSMIATFTSVGAGQRFYETGAVVVTLVLLGRYLESRVKTRAGRTLQTLLGLSNAVVRRIQADGTDAEVPVAKVHRGDRLRIRPGERIPADGVVVDGLSSVDETVLTGDTLPVDKMPGDTVMAGSMNWRGSFEMEVQCRGEETALAEMARMVSAAQDTRVGLQDLADRVAEVFVPIVVILAALTFFFWYVTALPGDLTTALMTGMAVLVVACPSAIALAGPTAVMAGTERAADLGILVKGAGALERAAKLTTVVLRKAGILTAGQPEVVAVHGYGAWVEADLIRMVGSLARGSEHPVALALQAVGGGLELPDVLGFQAFEGLGISGDVAGRHVVVGSRRLLAARSIDTGALEPLAQPLESRGRTVVFVAVDGALAGLMAVGDDVKPSAVVAVRRLKAMGLEVLVLSGDSRRTTLALAENVGADGAISEIDPDHRATLIRRLGDGRKRLAVVGDGMADADALAAADVGIAIGAGTDLGLKASDLTLVSADLAGVPAALALARRSVAIMRQNLFWAFFYNTLGIPVAAGVIYPLLGWTISPMVAAGAMGLSSLMVVGNSLRLRGRSTDAA